VTTQWLRAQEHAAHAWESEARATANAAEARDKEAEAKRERDAAQALNDQLRRLNYAVQMNLVQAAWESDNIGRVQELLDQQIPQAGQTDLRGFEWHYWRRMCQTALRTLQFTDLLGTVTQASLSGDGSRLAAAIPLMGSDDYKAMVWDTASGKQLLAVPLKMQSSGDATAILSRDGRRLVTVVMQSLQGTKYLPADIRVWDVLTGKQLAALRPEDGGAYYDLTDNSFTVDGSRLALAGTSDLRAGKGKVDLKIWDGLTARQLLVKPNSGRLSAPVFSADGRRLAASVGVYDPRFTLGVSESRVQIWDAATGEVLRTFDRAKDYVAALVFSPDGKRLASVGGQEVPDMEIQVCDADTGKELVRIPSTQRGLYSHLVFSPDGKLLAGCGGAQVIKVWDVATGKTRQTLKGHSKSVLSLAFATDGGTLYSAAADGTVRVWEIKTQDEVPTDEKEMPSFGFMQGTISADATRVAQVEGRGPFDLDGIEISDLAGNGSVKLKLASGHSHGMAFSADVQGLACAWHLTGDQETLSGSYELHVWDTTTGQPRFTIPGEEGMSLDTPAFSPDGTRVACSFALIDRKTQFAIVSGVKTWDAKTGKGLATMRAATPSHAAGLAFSPDGAWIVGTRWSKLKSARSADDKSSVVIWNAADGREVCTLEGLSHDFNLLAFSPDGKWLAAATGAYDGQGDIELWQFAPKRPDAGKKSKYVLKGHAGRIQSLAFSPDSRRIVSGAGTLISSGNELKIWDVATGQELLTLKPGGIDLGTLCFSPDGHRLLALRVRADQPRSPLKTWDATPLAESSAKGGQ
jgi:WD40 repeat protein